MLRLALQDSSWIRVSDWECHQEEWTRTRLVLQYHQVNMRIFGGCAVARPFHYAQLKCWLLQVTVSRQQ